MRRRKFETAMRLRSCLLSPVEHLQDVETTRQLRSRFARGSTYRSVRLTSSLAAALLGRKRVLARWGWAGEKAGLFEHPAGNDLLDMDHAS